MLLTLARLPFFLLVAGAYAASLPSFMNPPCVMDKNFNECAKQKAQKAVAILVKGDRKLGIPPMNPMHVPEVKIADGGPRQAGFTLILHDLEIYGFGDALPTDMNYDFDKKLLRGDFITPECKILAKYSISGRILLLPITGKGDLNCTMTNAKLGYIHTYDFVEKNGRKFMNIKNFKGTITPERMYLTMTNLFNGDKLLDERKNTATLDSPNSPIYDSSHGYTEHRQEMNVFFDRNWKEVYSELGPAIDSTFTEIFNSMLDKVIEQMPFDEMFPKPKN